MGADNDLARLSRELSDFHLPGVLALLYYDGVDEAPGILKGGSAR